MAQSSKYARLDQDVLLEFIYHDQTVATLPNYQIEIDNNGSHVLALNTTSSLSDTRHLIAELGAAVVNFDVTASAAYILIENFASRPLTLANGKTYKFDVSALAVPGSFAVKDLTGASLGSLSLNTYTFTPTTNGSFTYEYPNLIGGKITVQNSANSLFATADEETGNDIKTGAGQPGRYQAVLVDAELGSRYALLDSTNNFIDNYTNWTGSTSSTIDMADVSDIQLNTITYDTVRLHLRSGFSFSTRGYDGFLFQIGAARVSGVKNYLTSIAYLNTSSFEIQNPKPFILGETMYSKFIEIKIPALANMDTDFIDWFFGTGNDAVNPNANYEVEYKLITSIDDSTGFDYINTGEEVKFTVAREDEYQDLAAVIEEATDGDYFNLYMTKDGSITSFDSYIAGRKQMTSDDITVFYDISVYEQVTSYFDKSFTMSISQVENFDIPTTFRPIIRNASNASAYNIDLVVRIYNETNNTQIVKHASFTSYDVGKFGKKLRTINLPASNQVLKVYNTLPNVLENKNIIENLSSLPSNQTRFVPSFIERNNIVTGSTNVTVVNNEIVDNNEIRFYADGESNLTLSPFDNYIKFKIAKKSGDDLINVSLETVQHVILNLGSIEIENSLNYTDVELGEGEIMFRIDESLMTAISKNTDRVYMLSIHNGTDKTLIHHGTFDIIGNNVIKVVKKIQITDDGVKIKKTIVDQKVSSKNLNKSMDVVGSANSTYKATSANTVQGA